MAQRKEKKPKLTDAERHKRFVETATQVDASEDIDVFDKAFSSLTLRSSPKPTRKQTQ